MIQYLQLSRTHTLGVDAGKAPRAEGHVRYRVAGGRPPEEVFRESEHMWPEELVVPQVSPTNARQSFLCLCVVACLVVAFFACNLK